ncbi:hypothetical protein DICPUDRAFT_149619 [Dictyostelium purpureum]|uniref:Superoxide dismutase copper/zinc binding domain-containing protein n=1 Tax=Dictyostelium purpureum TaxID=5786 RepID=F0ZE53_DICPU|nr:uncharacterized protein DICPUDRAFT_149619 [Dictyostelium purpureum]EGC37789.1 hypothetical protein DICPUDRAFT_149619 [Dictyostelium purpureum]|eukprot:XP_003285728.1 hypothetical protein DICPUDRAFT_149619 [Dictyostelium purpureum]
MRFISLLIVFFLLKSAIVLADYQYAICNIVPVDKTAKTISGSIQIYKESESTSLTFDYDIKAENGLEDGNYGNNIQSYGYPSTNLGGVFNPGNAAGPCPESEDPIVGSLNDISLNNGIYIASKYYQTPLLSGENSIIGRAISFYDSSICKEAPQPTLGALATSNLGALAEPTLIATCVIGFGNDTTKPDELTGSNTASSPELNLNAISVLTAAPNTDATITGQVTFVNVEGGVQISSKLNGLSKEAHGFHIHSFGQLSDNGSALGGHWATTGQTHSLPSTLQNSATRHYGDLGNICAFDSEFKNAYYNFTTNYISINGVYGRGFAIHATRDLGDSNVGGARVAQGVIAIANPDVTLNLNTPPTTDFTFDNICANGAFDGQTKNSTSSGSESASGSESDSENGSSKIISSLFVLGLFSSLFVLLL